MDLATVACVFVLQVAAGISAALLLVPPESVAGRFFRNKLLVVLGLVTVGFLLAGPSAASQPTGWPFRGMLLAAGVLAYIGSAVWLLERPLAGRFMLIAVAALSGVAAAAARGGAWAWDAAETASGGLALGMPIVAMLLGHWYLNAPGTPLGAIQRLTQAAGVVLAIRAAVVLIAFATGSGTALPVWLAVTVRIGTGLLVPLGLTVMVWWTLKIPNTQSATGILYAMVVLVTIGEVLGLVG